MQSAAGGKSGAADKCDSGALPAVDNIAIGELHSLGAFSGRPRKTSGLMRAHSSMAVINIALSNEKGQPDAVEIDKADDEEDNSPISPLVNLAGRTSNTVRHTTTPESGTPTKCASSLVGAVKHKPITERLLRRRNSENAFHVVMQVAQTRKETLVKLLDEHQQIVKEIEKWSSLASLQSNNAPVAGHDSRLASDAETGAEPLLAD